MQTNFQKALKAILVYEGGYSNHPRDPGGVTLEGIIQRVYDAYRKRKGRLPRTLTKAMRDTAEWIAERDEIYRVQYWDAVRADQLPAGLDVVLLDCAVNSGPYQAALWLQRALRMHDIDGHIGENTLMAAMSHPDHDQLIADLLARRMGMLRNLSTWEDFGKGWTNRVNSVKAIGQAWAMGSVGPDPVAAHEDRGDAKAYASDVHQAPIPEEIATGTAYGGTGLAGAIQAAQQGLERFVGTSDFMTNVYIALTVIAVVVAVVGAAGAWWAKRKNDKARRAINGEIVESFDEGGAPMPAAA